MFQVFADFLMASSPLVVAAALGDLQVLLHILDTPRDTHSIPVPLWWSFSWEAVLV